jgi:hypothetical protein
VSVCSHTSHRRKLYQSSAVARRPGATFAGLDPQLRDGEMVGDLRLLDPVEAGGYEKHEIGVLKILLVGAWPSDKLR